MDTPADLLLRPALLAQGHTDKELLRLRRSGELATVRRGAYLRSGDERLDRPEDRHALLIDSTLPRLAPGAVLSHVSAAIDHGLSVWDVPLDRVHVSRDGRSGGRLSGKLHLHVRPLEPEDVVERDGRLVTSAELTLVDIACTQPFEQAVAIIDQALRKNLCTREQVAVALARAAGRPGVSRAHRALRFGDGRADGIGESRSRCALEAAGLPTPELQWEVRSAAGDFLGRVDFAWPELGVVGEFDGRVKYSRYLKPGQSASDAVIAEKLREDRIRSTGLWVVRWTWADLARFGPIADELRARLGFPLRSRARIV
jgi:hypothetical protein